MAEPHDQNISLLSASPGAYDYYSPHSFHIGGAELASAASGIVDSFDGSTVTNGHGQQATKDSRNPFSQQPGQPGQNIPALLASSTRVMTEKPVSPVVNANGYSESSGSRKRASTDSDDAHEQSLEDQAAKRRRIVSRSEEQLPPAQTQPGQAEAQAMPVAIDLTGSPSDDYDDPMVGAGYTETKGIMHILMANPRRKYIEYECECFCTSTWVLSRY